MNRATAFDQFTRTDPRFTADEFMMMDENGAFDDIRVELVRGELIRTAPPHSGHSRAQFRTANRIEMARPAASEIHVEATVRFDNRTIRVLDVVLAREGVEPTEPLVPGDILLAVEIADSTLARDLGDKQDDYARAGIPHYWVVDVRARVVHVMSEPDGDTYGSRETIRFGETLLIPGSDQPITIN